MMTTMTGFSRRQHHPASAVRFGCGAAAAESPAHLLVRGGRDRRHRRSRGYRRRLRRRGRCWPAHRPRRRSNASTRCSVEKKNADKLVTNIYRFRVVVFHVWPGETTQQRGYGEWLQLKITVRTREYMTICGPRFVGEGVERRRWDALARNQGGQGACCPGQFERPSVRRPKRLPKP